MKQLHIIVIGRVQGVWFRDTTRSVARQLGLKGFVRNLDDGSVEVIAEGDEEKLKKLVDFCHKGPPASRVDKVIWKFHEITGDFDGFEIRD